MTYKKSANSVRVMFTAAAIAIVASAAAAADFTTPIPLVTPGDVLLVDGVTPALEVLCRVGYTATVRHVRTSTERQVMAAYNIPWERRSEFEIDHLISLELGGSNDPLNLWPEPYGAAMGARIKDKLENRLHRLVCAGKLDLGDAQAAIAGDWLAAYQRYMAK